MLYEVITVVGEPQIVVHTCLPRGAKGRFFPQGGLAPVGLVAQHGEDQEQVRGGHPSGPDPSGGPGTSRLGPLRYRSGRQEDPPGGEVEMALVRHVEPRYDGVRGKELQDEPEQAEARHRSSSQHRCPCDQQPCKECGPRRESGSPRGGNGQIRIDVQAVDPDEAGQEVVAPVALGQQVLRNVPSPEPLQDQLPVRGVKRHGGRHQEQQVAVVKSRNNFV